MSLEMGVKENKITKVTVSLTSVLKYLNFRHSCEQQGETVRQHTTVSTGVV